MACEPLDFSMCFIKAVPQTDLHFIYTVYQSTKKHTNTTYNNLPNQIFPATSKKVKNTAREHLLLMTFK